MSNGDKVNNKIDIIVRNNNMEAWMKVSIPGENTITIAELKRAIADANIYCGIIEENLEQVITCKDSYKETLIAKGQEPIHGENGYFEYFFDRSVDTKPRILEDGSVDYYAMTRIVTVSQGDKVAEYHAATKEEDGFDIYGKELKATKGKELSVLKGKGFQLSEDKKIYTAQFTGKIELQNERLVISNVLEIKEDIDYLQGDIHFKGDLVIYGNVVQGKVVEADGNITIRGHVEGATIIAGKDIVFESGMQGAQKGFIISGGNVSGKFFEQVNIKVKGDLTANAIMNCKIESLGKIMITGKRGIILGGMTSALELINASIIGNENELKTELHVGIPDSIQFQLKNVGIKIDKLKEKLTQIDAATEMIEEREIPGKKNPFQVQKLQLMRTKINTNTEINELIQQRADLLHKLEVSKDAHIEVEKVIYPETTISVNGIFDTIMVETTHVAYYRKENEIETRNL